MIGTPELFVIFIILIIIGAGILFLFRGRQQQQQQIVIQGETGRKRICPKCGWQNDKEAKFCSDCGFKFSEKAETPNLNR